MTSLRRRSVFCSCFLAFACAAKAEVIYNNLSSPTNVTDAVGPAWGPLADSFSTPTSAFELTDVRVLLAGSPSAGSITVSLLSDTSTSPGAVLETIGSLSDNSLSSTLTAFDFPLAPYALHSSTRYWIELSANPILGSTAFWSYSLDQNALGVAGEHLANYEGGSHWLVFPNTSGPYQMELGNAVPEPSTSMLLAAGLLGITIERLRRKCLS